MPGEQAAHGSVPTRDYIRRALTTTSPMVTAPLAPLLVLLATRLAGASNLFAANAGPILPGSATAEGMPLGTAPSEANFHPEWVTPAIGH
jgi:hypothetical protein